jgi:hypothetical protein
MLRECGRTSTTRSTGAGSRVGVVTIEAKDRAREHFADDVEDQHEALRSMSLPGEAAWIPKAMPPIAELCPGDQAHRFVRGLALSHLDATLRQHPPARRLLAGDIEASLTARGVEAISYQP